MVVGTGRHSGPFHPKRWPFTMPNWMRGSERSFPRFLPARTHRRVDPRGVEPLTLPCEGSVFPIILRAHFTLAGSYGIEPQSPPSRSVARLSCSAQYTLKVSILRLRRVMPVFCL